MKKKGIAIAALIATSVALIAAGCKKPNNPNNPNNPNDPDNPGGPTGDTYEDYVPDKQPGGDQFDFEGNYKEPELKIDGKGDDAQWQAISTPLLTYGKNDAVSVKVYRGESALFFLFDVKDTRLLTWGESNDDTVTRGDSVEFYIDSKADGGRRPQNDDFQINLGIHGKTRIMQGSGVEWGSWNGLIDYEVTLNGTLGDSEEPTDVGYTVEAMVQYKDIAIDKNATIGLAFGQVDKVAKDDAASGTDDGPWNWYGWHYNGDFVDPKIPDTYVLYQPDGTLLSRDEQEKAPADMAGYVKDQDGNAVGGATVSVTGGVTQLTPVTTDEAGFFMFENVDPEGTYEVTVSKAGHISGVQTYTRAELRAADGGRVLKEFVIVNQATVERTTLTGTVKNVLNGVVGGATVTYKNTEISTTTNADGTFSLADIPMGVGDVAIVVTATGYAATETVVKEDALTSSATALGDVNLNLPAAETRAFGISNLLAANNGFITRTLDGIEMEFVGERTFNGAIELFIDTKESTPSRNATDVLYLLNSNGTVGVNNSLGGGNFTTSGIKWTVNHIDGAGYTAKLFIPYATLKISPLEPFGISLGQNNGQGVWDGWGRDDMPGVAEGGFVKPEIPQDYVRVGADNKLYEAANNNAVVTFGGTIKASGVALSGVTVAVGNSKTQTDAEGKWSLKVGMSAEGITVVYEKTGYVTKSTNISSSDVTNNSWSEEATLSEHKVTLSGVVQDQNDDPVASVTVTLTIGSDSRTATTDAQGRYSFENVTTFTGISVTFAKDGYAEIAATEISQTALASANNNVYALNKKLTETTAVKTVTVSGKVVGMDGALAGVAVSVEGKEISAVTDENGVFTLADFECLDSTIKMTLDGYLAGSYAFVADDVDGNSFTTPDVFLAKEYVALGAAFGAKSDDFAHFVPYVTRGETGFEFKFVGSKEFAGRIELFVDTGLSAGEGGRNASDYRFDLNATGAIVVDNWGGANTDASTLKLTVTGADTQTPTVVFSVPYAFLGVERTEIIGVSFGQWSTTANDWDGWNHTLRGANGEAYVRVEMPWDYIRIAKDCHPFWNAENKTVEELDLSSYNLHFGRLNDSIHAKVSRDDMGITFDFISLGDFSSAPDGLEAVLIYIDKGEPVAGWGNDYQYKIVSDGRVAFSNRAWWNIDNGTSKGNIEISRTGGVTRFSYKVLYEDIGADRNEVLGFALVEGWLTGDNASNEYGGMIYTHDTGYFTMGDAANEATFVRIKADGTLVVANSNAAVTE